MAATPRENRRLPERKAATGGGGGWLLLLVLLGGAAATVVFYPQVFRGLFGPGSRPPEGAPPQVAQQSQTDLKGRELSPKADLGKVTTVDRSAAPKPVVAAPVPVKAPAAPIRTYKDESSAQTALGEARAAYKAFRWDSAVSAARKVAVYDAKPETKVRAKDVIRGAQTLESLFKELDAPDELVRNFDTSPGLVEIVNSTGSTSFAVPIRSIDDKTPIEQDALGYLNAQRASGTIYVMLKGMKNFMPAQLKSDQLGEIRAVDIAVVMQELREEFTTRLSRLKNGENVNDALAWYDAAKFAYRNRLDEQVTEMMDQAVLLDPFLVKSVREDRAETLAAHMLVHLKNDNKKQADAFMAIINRKFADTDNGKQAKLLYDGKGAEALVAQRDAEAKRRADEAARRDARKARATELGDATEVARIEREPVAPAAPSRPGTATAGDEGKADEFFIKGRTLYSQAIDAGNSSKRDQLYSQAAAELGRAMDIYNVLLEKRGTDSSLASKALECNKLRYGAKKQQRY